MNSIIESLKLKPADCTLACEKGHLTAHKLILCAHSKYLLDILSKFPNAEHPIIILTELNITDIKTLVNYMYTGELIITGDCSPTSLLRAAQILKIDSLTDFDENDDVVDDDDELEEEEELAHLEASQPVVSHSHPHTNHHQQQQQQLHHHLNHHLEMNLDDEDEMDEEEEDDLDMHHQNEQAIDVSLNNNNNRRSTAINNNNHHATTIMPPNDIDHHLGSSQQISISKAQSQISKHNDNNNKIRCHLCNIGLSDVKCLYRHVLTRHLPEKWGYKCEFCDREFSRDDHLMRHYTTKHKNMEFNREKIRETRRLNREMAKNFHDQMSTICK